MVFCIVIDGRYIPVQIRGFQYQFFDLPRIIKTVISKVHSPLIALEISPTGNGGIKINYLAKD